MNARRDHGMDALRTLAVLAMMASHTSRLIPFDLRPAWAQTVLLLEPLTPSLFLLLVGLSLARSFESALARGLSGGAWYLRQLRRAAILWVISTVFFTLELGFRLPDAVTASGILSNIAYAIALIGGLFTLSRSLGKLPPWLPVLPVWIAGIALFLWIDETGRRPFILTTGNSPLLPLTLFALAGALWGSIFGGQKSARPANHPPVASWRWIGPVLAISAAAVALILIFRLGLDPLFTKPLGRSDAGRLVPAPVYGGATVYLGYYNLRPILAFVCLGIQLGALALLTGLLRKLPERSAAFVFALGRDALAAYILHLSLLAILVVTLGLQPLTQGWQVAAVWFTLIVVCMISARWRKKLGYKGSNRT